MSAAVFEHEPGSAPAAMLSVVVHVALFAFLYFGVSWQSKRPDAVVVELWDRPAVVEPPPVEPIAPRPEPPVQQELVAPPPPPKVEATPPKPDIVIEKEQKKKKAPPKERPKREPAIKIDRNAAIREQLAKEMEQVAKSDQRTRPLPAGPVADPSYTNKIKTKIRSNIVLPPDITGNPEAIFDVVQLPTGEVLSARLRKSSGNRPYDDAVERAILKSSPLPRPDRPEQFSRDLELKFRPQDQ